MSDKQWSHRLFHPLQLIRGTGVLWRNSTVLFLKRLPSKEPGGARGVPLRGLWSPHKKHLL